jgi:hypothetical protein
MFLDYFSSIYEKEYDHYVQRIKNLGTYLLLNVLLLRFFFIFIKY